MKPRTLTSPAARFVLRPGLVPRLVRPQPISLASMRCRSRWVTEGTRGGNAGEAESIYFAESLAAIFATDDNAAYVFAASELFSA